MIIDTQIMKPHPGTEPKGEPIKADCWKNIWFTKSGVSYLGWAEFQTEQAASARAKYALLENNNAIRVIKGPITCRDGFPCIWKKDILSVAQIPWKKQ